MHFGSKYVYIEPDDAAVAPLGPVTRDVPHRVNYATIEPPILGDEEPKQKPLHDASGLSQNTESTLSLTDKEFSVKNLVNSTREVTNWNQLGLQVDLSPEQLKIIKTNYSDPQDAKAEMYDVWKKSDPDASWAKLSRGLQQSGHFVLSQNIYREYVEDSSSAILKKSAGPKEKKVGFSPSTNEHDGPASQIDGVQRRLNDTGYHINSNMMAIKFKVLAESKDIHTGDPTVCTNKDCTAILSSISTIKEEKEEGRKVWECEFCQTENEVDVMNEEIPLKEDVLYLLEPSKSMRVSGKNIMEGQTAAAKDAIVVFCIDISGSMGCTTEVPGKFKLKGHERTEALHRQHSQGHIQFLPRERRDVTYISRLQGIQGAIEQQLNILSRNYPTQKVALVTFNDEVIVCCDGRDEIVITGDKLGNYSSIEKIGKGLALPTALSKTKDHFIEKVYSLEESGQTALGPAMLTSILLAGKVPGSKIIVCTDGLANVGIGKLDAEITSREQLADATKFYTNLGTLAREKSITVSVLSTKGCESRLLELGRVADITGGRVNVVDPLKVKEDFANILANPIIATQVISKIVLHSDMCFSSMGKKSNDRVLTIPVGNATNSTELSYEFEIKDSVKPRLQEAAMAKFSSTVTINGEEHIPFQLHIEYTGTDKSRYLRVFTKTMPATTDLQRADDKINDGVMGRHALRRLGSIGHTLNYPRLTAYSDMLENDLMPRLRSRRTVNTGQQAAMEEFADRHQRYKSAIRSELKYNESDDTNYELAYLNGEAYRILPNGQRMQSDESAVRFGSGHEGYETPGPSYEEKKMKHGRGACAPELLDKMDGANVLSVVEENVTDQDMSGSQENSVNESDEDGKCDNS